MRRLSTANIIYILLHFCLLVLGLFLCTRSNTVVQAVGTSLVATGIAGWVILVHVIQSERFRERIRMLTEFGFQAAFDARSVRIRNEYDQRLHSVSRTVDIMGFGLKTLREDYRNEFAVWKTRANVRILIIDPEFPISSAAYSDQRDKEERDAPGTIRQDVQAFLNDVEQFRRSPGDKIFDVRLYRCLPSVNLFRIDDQLFWGPYLINQQSRNSPTFVIKRGPLFDMLTRHFDQIWESDELSCSVEHWNAQRLAK